MDASNSTIQIRIERASTAVPRLIFTAEFPSHEGFEAQLPTWRPGRYELGQFAQFVFRMEGQDLGGSWEALRKTDLHRWFVPAGIQTVRWEFYADIFNAGSTGIGDDIVYINPVNCILYHPDHQDWGVPAPVGGCAGLMEGGYRFAHAKWVAGC